MFQIYNRIVNRFFPKSNNSTTYFPGIYGLRALMLIAIILHHQGLSFMKGGNLGITVLLVITGYLVTRSLLDDLEKTGRIDILGFYKKRAIKIFPPLLTMIALMSIISAIFGRELIPGMRNDLFSSVFQFNNWWQIFHNINLKEGFLLPLEHIWAVSLVVQFFIIWAPILFLIYRYTGNDGIAYIVMGAVSAISIVLMAFLSPTRVYYGTDTRVFSLLIGSALAHYTGNPRERIWKYPVYMVDMAGGVSVLALIFLMVFMEGDAAVLYRGGHVLTAVLGALILLSAFRPSSILGRVLSFNPLTWIGRCSYSLYLWHYPIIMLFEKGEEVKWWVKIIEIVLTLVIATISYRFIEQPLRRGAVQDAYRVIDGNPTSSYEKAEYRRVIKKVRIVLGATLAIIILSIICLAAVPGKLPSETYDLSQGNFPTSDGTDAEEGEVKLPRNVKDANILMIGDDFAVDSNNAFIDAFPHILVDVSGGRSATSGAPIYEAYVSGGWEGEIVIYALTNSGSLYDALEDLREKMKDGQLLFIMNTRMPDVDWEYANNSAISEFVNVNRNSYAIDWYGASEGHGEYFSEDGVSLSEEGAEAYANLAKVTIEAVLKN